MLAYDSLFSAIEHIMVSIAIIVGGIWTLVTFSKLKSKNTADAKLTEVNYNNAKLNYELFQKGGVLNIDVTVAQIDYGSSQNYDIAIDITISNDGTKNTLLDLTQQPREGDIGRVLPPLIISEVIFDNNGKGVLRQISFQTHESSIVMRPGYTINLPFFARVPKAGVYNIDFYSRLDFSDILIDNYTRGKKTPITYWHGCKYIVIR